MNITYTAIAASIAIAALAGPPQAQEEGSPEWCEQVAQTASLAARHHQMNTASRWDVLDLAQELEDHLIEEGFHYEKAYALADAMRRATDAAFDMPRAETPAGRIASISHAHDQVMSACLAGTQ